MLSKKKLYYIFTLTLIHISCGGPDDNQYESEIQVWRGEPATEELQQRVFELSYFYEKNKKSVFTGSFVAFKNKRAQPFILTCAHTFKHFNRKKQNTHLDLKLGSMVYPIPDENIIIHPDFEKDIPFSKHDLALIKIPKEYKLPEWIKPIPMAYCDELPSEIEMIQVGYGRDTPLTYCSYLKNTGRFCMPLDNQFIVVENENQSMWPGDSGGPLLVIKDQKTWQIGTLSIGSYPRSEEEKNQKNLSYHALYTKLSPYYSWIEKTTKQKIIKNQLKYFGVYRIKHLPASIKKRLASDPDGQNLLEHPNRYYLIETAIEIPRTKSQKFIKTIDDVETLFKSLNTYSIRMLEDLPQSYELTTDLVWDSMNEEIKKLPKTFSFPRKNLDKILINFDFIE